MTWFNVCDTLHAHPKARKAGLAAMGLWAVAGSWSAGALQEGFVPRWFVDSWPSGRKLAGRLVDAGLWTAAERDGESGWRFHDWEHRQPTAERERARKEKNRERQRRHRQRTEQPPPSRVTSRVTNGVTDAVSHDPLPLPHPRSSHVEGEGYGSNPRDPGTPPPCPKHTGLPRELVPDCWACGQRRQQWQAQRGADVVFQRPPWCGNCDPHTRLIERAGGDGGDVVEQCPACHPLAVTA